MSLKGRQTLPESAVHGICALMWLRATEAPLGINVTDSVISAKGLAMLSRAMTPVVTSLHLGGSDVANRGGDLSGLQQLCKALCEQQQSRSMTELNLQDNRLGRHAATLIG